MKIAITTLACVLGLGLTACVQEESASAKPTESPKAAPGASKKSAPAAGMTVTTLELSKVP